MKWSRFLLHRPVAGRNVIGAAMRPLGIVSAPYRLIIDFLAEDSCVLCGSGRHVSPARDEGMCGDRNRADQMRALTLPVEVPFLLGTLRNRPVCPACAMTFEAAQNVGCLGYAELGRRVVTVGRAAFECHRDDGRTEELSAPEACFPIRIVAPWMTNDAVLCIVHILKYKSCTSLVQVVARSISACVERLGQTIAPQAVLLPVPRFGRTRSRPDHAAAIAAALSAELGLPWESAKLRKIRSTHSQSMTPRALRARNVRGAFTARGVRNRDVILVDDLVTTGSTAASCTAALVSAGARSVTLFCFGRAL